MAQFDDGDQSSTFVEGDGGTCLGHLALPRRALHWFSSTMIVLVPHHAHRSRAPIEAADPQR
jgi:hypothetical protein